jgi:RimJ/RimL family protein N-acetyltransferase
MRFTRFGISLERLRQEHLEFIRQWRNSDWVRPNMRYRKFIAPEDQVRWFKAMDQENNWYFVAYIGDLSFALFHIRDIDWKQERGEAGGFVGYPRFIGQPEPAETTLALMDFAFLVLQLKSLQAHYNAQQPRIAQFNQQLGYETEQVEADGFLRASVTAERYLEHAGAFRKAALALHGPSAILTDPPLSLSRRIEQVRTLWPADFQIQISGGGGPGEPTPGLQHQR